MRENENEEKKEKKKRIQSDYLLHECSRLKEGKGEEQNQISSKNLQDIYSLN